MNAIEIKAAKGVHQNAVKLLTQLFSQGKAAPTVEAYYVLTGIHPNKLYPSDYDKICRALDVPSIGDSNVEGELCPEAITSEQFATLQAKLS
jgi:hypothetical protein